MSHEALAFVKTLNVPISSHKLLLMALAERISNETGECFPGQALLARECSKSDRQIRNITADLEEAGLIVRRKRKKANGHADSDAYTITGFMQWLSIVDSLKVGDAEAATKKLIELQVIQKKAENPTGNPLPVGDEIRAGIGNPTGNPLPVANRKSVSAKPSEENPHTQPLLVVGSTPTAATPKSRKKQGELLKTEIEENQEQEGQKRIDAARDEESKAFAAYVDLAKFLGQSFPPKFAYSYRTRLRGILDLEGEWPRADGSVRFERLGLAGWLYALHKIRTSAYCRGDVVSKSGNKFKLIFKVMASESGIVDVMSGTFDDKDKSTVVDMVNVPGRHYTPEQWRIRLRLWIEGGCVKWYAAAWGPKIGEPGCYVIKEVLEEPEFRDKIVQYQRQAA